MKLFYTVLIVAIMFIFCSAAHSWGVIEKGPYLQNVGKHQITIMWESLYETKSRVDYGLTEEYGLFVEDPKEVIMHEITLHPLKPNTKYYYRVTCSLSKRTGSFKTAPNFNMPFKFTVYGDSQINPNIHEKIAEKVLKIKPDIMLHTGDLVSNGERYYLWEEAFFDPLRDVINHIPIYPALGNHERNAKNYFKFFSLPNNESWYSFNYSNCHFVVLDSNKDFTKGSPQYRWLKNDLQNTNTKWKFVFFHHSPYTSGRHPSNLKVRNILTPLFRKHGVDVVFCGHNHQYERSYPIGSAFALDEQPITYIVSGGGGGTLYDYTAGKPWTKKIIKINNFCVVSIDGEEMTLKAFDIDGGKLDEFSIAKSKGKYKKYLDMAIYYEQMEFENNLIDNIKSPIVLLNGNKAPFEDAIKIKNPFPGVVSFKVTWHHLNNWDIRPKQAVVDVGSDKIARIPFTFDPPRSSSWPPPMFSISYDTGLSSGKVTDNYLKVLSSKEIICQKAGKSVEIDGHLDERFWKSVPPANGFIQTDFSGLAVKQTTAKVAYDNNAIYLAVICSEPGSKKLTANVNKRDGNIVNDEAVIISIAPNGGDKMVYQFGVNCDGTEYDAKDGVKEWSGEWESKAQINDGDWIVEIAIPYNILELTSAPEKGDRWKINFYRSTIENSEKSEWSATLDSPLDIERLGLLTIN